VLAKENKLFSFSISPTFLYGDRRGNLGESGPFLRARHLCLHRIKDCNGSSLTQLLMFIKLYM